MARYAMALDLTRCVGCQTCVVGCQLEHNTRPGVAWGTVEPVEMGSGWPDVDRVYMPHACMHCENAPCVAACPTGASVQREDGIVVVDYDTCTGCGTCITACPYHARQISTNDAWYFDAAEPAPYEAYGAQRINVAEKCVFCSDRVDQGKAPRCVEACFCGVRVFGDLDDPDSEISAFLAANETEQAPGAAVYYVKGSHDFDLVATLMGTSGNDEKDGE